MMVGDTGKASNITSGLKAPESETRVGEIIWEMRGQKYLQSFSMLLTFGKRLIQTLSGMTKKKTLK